MYIDSHCHINDERLYEDREKIIEEAKKEGVSTLLIIGWDLESSKKAIEIADAHEGVYAAIGFHPENLDDISLDALEEIKELAKKEKKVIAIGEIGLDYHWYKEKEHREKQKYWFIKQIELANDLYLPISIHAREASEDVYKILKEHKPIKSGVLHCYSGSVEMLKEFQKLGMYFGFDGPITFKNAIEPKRCVEEVDINKILSETDCPYLTPHPHRGETNYPKYIPLIVEKMAELKGIDVEEMKKHLEDNFKKLFLGDKND